MNATAERLAPRIAEQNQEIKIQAGIQAVTGIAYCLFMCGALWLTLWFFSTLCFSDFMAPSLLALLATLVFAGASTFEAWRRVDPFANLEPLAEWQRTLTAISLAVPNFVYFSPQHASAGLAFLLLAGPESLFSATRLWRSRLPDNPDSIIVAAELLRRSQNPLPAKQVPAEAAATLYRLSLVKILVTAKNSEPVIAITEKGQSLLAAPLNP